MRIAILLAKLVKLEHTIFALPFAYGGMTLAAVVDGDVSLTWTLTAYVTLAMVAARTAAMALNRLIDRQIDARNPRTRERELAAGLVTPATVWALIIVSIAVLVFSTTKLAPITQVLWPIPVSLFVLYPYTKRFTWLCHVVLGVSIGLAPLGAWLATGASGAHIEPYLMWLGIAAWIGGFDIIYALDDIEFDRANGLRSIPARFGIATSLRITSAAHATTIAAFIAVGLTAPLGDVFWVCLFAAAAVLVWENRIVTPTDLSRINRAFFTANSYVGVVLGGGIVIASLLQLR